MEFKMNDKTYNPILGIKALEKLDKKFNTHKDNITIGTSIIEIPIKYQMCDPSLILDILSVCDYEENAPTEKELEEYIENLSEKEMDKLFEDTYNFFSTAPVIRFRLMKLNKK